MKISISLTRENNAPATTPQLRKLFRAAAAAACTACGLQHNAEVSLLLTDDEGIRELNRAYRHKDAATDVLSFALAEDEQGQNELQQQAQQLPDDIPLLLGDIVISYQHAQAQAEKYGHSLLRETVFLFTHGMLHLLGHDHERGPAEEKAMFELQEQIMTQLGLPR